LEKVVNRDILIKFIKSPDQVADFFTKGLPSAQFLLLKSKLVVVPSTSLRGVVKICDPNVLVTHDEDQASTREHSTTPIMKDQLALQQLIMKQQSI